MKKLTACLLILVIFLSSWFNVACGVESVPASATLGFALDSFADRIETVITTAGNTGRGVLIQAGTEAYLAVQQAKIAFDDSLNKAVDKLDVTVTKKLQEIGTMVQDLESGIDEKIATISGKAQQIANTLPFANIQPQVTFFSPHFLSSLNSAVQTEVGFSGNFMFAQKEGFKPSLQVGDKNYPADENTTQSIRFLVGSGFASPQESKITNTKVKLSVPYEESSFLFFKKQRVATYNIIIGTLPPTPGKITLMKKNVVQQPERQHIVTQSWQQHSSNDDIKDRPYSGPDHPGWRIVDSSVRFVDEWHQGDLNDQWSFGLNRTNPTVVFIVTTIHHRIGTSGKVNFHFEYDIERTVPVENWQPEAVDLTWGQSRAFPAEPNSWKVIFESFDGQKREIVSPEKGAFLEVRIEGGNVVLNVPAARNIKLS